MGADDIEPASFPKASEVSNCETPLKPIAEAAVFFKKSRRFMASLLEEDVGLSLRYGPRYPGSSRVLQQLPA